MLGRKPAKKRAVNLFVDSELLDEARKMRVNLSETLEDRLSKIVSVELDFRWREANRQAIASINDFIERRGLLADRLRYRSDGE